MTYTLKFDGGSLNNPGISAGASVIFKDNYIIDKAAIYIPHGTNNIAEYNALILGLQRAISLKIKKLNIQGDSLLVVNQIIGKYRVKNDVLKKLHAIACELLSKIEEYTIKHVYRKDNTDADSLADLCILIKSNITN